MRATTSTTTDKCNAIQKADEYQSQMPFQQQATPSLPTLNVPLEPLLFYLRDHELYYTALSGPRYNEYALFIDIHEWDLSATTTFYQYLKLIKAYRTLLHSLTKKLMLIILPTGYIETCRFFDVFTYWKDYDPSVLQFVQKIIPDVHICLHDYISYQMRFFASPYQAQRCIQNTCLQLAHFKDNCFCQQIAHYDVTCTIFRRHTLCNTINYQNSNEDTVSSVSSQKPEDFQDSQDPYEL